MPTRKAIGKLVRRYRTAYVVQLLNGRGVRLHEVDRHPRRGVSVKR